MAVFCGILRRSAPQDDTNMRTINISNSTIIRTLLIIIGLILLYLLRDILLIVIVSVIIASALSEPAAWLQKHKVPRLLGVIFIYLLLVLILAAAVSLVVPLLAGQISHLADNFPAYLAQIGLVWERFNLGANFQIFLERLDLKLSQAASGALTAIIGIFGGFFSAIVILFISFYLTVQENGIKKFFISLIPLARQSSVSDLAERIEKKVGGWLRGQIILMVLVGLLTYLGLRLLNVKYALTLGLLAGLLEIVPYVGPIFSAAPGVILGFIQSPALALLVILVYVVVQQLESYVLTPQIMKKAVGLNPLVIILAIMVGFELAGILGIVLSIPLTAAIAEVFKVRKKKSEA